MSLVWLFLSQTSLSGSISFEERVRFHVKAQQTVIELDLTHRGDEDVLEVKVVAVLDREEVPLGIMDRFTPGQKVNLKSKRLETLFFGERGSYVIPVIVYWKDLNGLPYETLSAQRVILSKSEDTVRFRLNPEELKITAESERVDAEITVENLIKSPIDLKLTPVITAGAKLVEFVSKVHLGALETKKVMLRFKVPRALKESQSSNAIIAEWRQGGQVEMEATMVRLVSSGVGNELPVIFTKTRIIIGLLLSLGSLLLLLWRQNVVTN